jgi:predicted permease
MMLAYPLSKLFVRNASSSAALTYQRNIYKYAMTFGNYGFMGDFLILGVFGDDMFFRYKLFTLGVGIACSSWGLFILIPKEENSSTWSKLKKGLLTPPMIAIVVGIAAGLLGLKAYIPEFIMRALESAGNCQGPVAMVLAGLVIGGYNLKELLTNKKVYVASLLRLIVLPALIVLILKVLGTEDQIITLALICFATPLGLNTIVYPATYGGETKTGASMTVISHTLSVITIPLMYLVFVTIL